MFVVNEDLSIYATRGDIVCLNVSAKDDRTGEAYEFQPGDIVQMMIYRKKNAEDVVMQKDFPVPAKTNTVGIFLTEQDTKIGNTISKPTDYWYQVTLNPYTNPQTFIGYDDDGAKIFKLFPEGKDITKDEPTKPEDIPVVDEDLSLLSSRPVENKAIARAITLVKNDMALMDSRLTGKIKANKKSGEAVAEELAVERARIDNLVSGATADDSEVVDIRVGADGVTYESAGTAVREQINALSRAVSKKYSFEFGGLVGDTGAMESNKIRIRTFIPCFNRTFKIANVSLPSNTEKATVVGFLNGEFVANLYSCVSYDGKSITVNIANGYNVDELGLCFKHNDNSEFVAEDISNSYVECSATAVNFTKQIDRLNECVFITQKPLWGVIGTDGTHATNDIALTTGFIPCDGEDFVLTGMDGFVLLRCVGRSTDGEYAVLQTKHQGGAYSVSVNGIESVSFSFYKNVSGGVYETITEEDYTNANFSYMSSLNALSQRIEEVYNKVDFGRNKMASLGDSITYGFIPRNTDGYPGQLDSFAKIAADYFGMEFENHGIAGSTVAIVDGAEPMCERVDLLPEDADVVTFMGGTNDIRKGVSLGTMTDRDGSTFYGALHVVMSALYKKYMVDKEFEVAKKTRVVICTPIKLLDNYYANRQGDGVLVNLVPWVNAIKEVANYYSLPVLDFYNLSMINPHLNRTVKGTEEGYTGYYNPHITDGTHPTQEGAQLMANALISFLKNI